LDENRRPRADEKDGLSAATGTQDDEMKKAAN
jgi:hypothetical protein